MGRSRRSFTSALAGVFGLPGDKNLWPDVILGVFLALALLFSLGSLAELVFDRTFAISTIAALVLVLCAKEKRAVLAGALVFVALRFLIAVFIGFDKRALAIGISCLAVAGALLWWSNFNSQ